MSADGTFDLGPLLRISRCPQGERWTLTFTRSFAHVPRRLWDALTDPAQLALWAPYTADRNLARIGPATLFMVDGEHRTELVGDVSLSLPPTVLEHRFGPDLPGGSWWRYPPAPS
ncbi:hypothetical protein GCM10009841_33150 [Microlunatus panaciterrae]|uniref:Uncharacterized protein YndB with AHSA1/START domain n=1 Tax=Microlunatus panaciterrae TaxID=400768 RepID=A0ABS2RH20_9ACTN|nr:hypothetical protein [Microlunatus panaciterrae]MBM7797973.1 uncharacterized protein YndB with AHSA1/START domain [Microlunatus panaciterrae]